MDGSGEYYIKWHDPDSERQKSRVLICRSCISSFPVAVIKAMTEAIWEWGSFGLWFPGMSPLWWGGTARQQAVGQQAWPEQEAGNSILYCEHKAEKTTTATITKYKWYNAFYFKACLKRHTSYSQTTSPKSLQIMTLTRNQNTETGRAGHLIQTTIDPDF